MNIASSPRQLLRIDFTNRLIGHLSYYGRNRRSSKRQQQFSRKTDRYREIQQTELTWTASWQSVGNCPSSRRRSVYTQEICIDEKRTIEETLPSTQEPEVVEAKRQDCSEATPSAKRR